MNPSLRHKLGSHLLGGLTGGGLAFLLGVGLLCFRVADGLTRYSYDLPFAIGKSSPPAEVVIVYLDAASHTELKQPFNQPWDRTLHAKLLSRLTALQARAVVFDVVFSDSWPIAGVDETFAAALKANGRSILAASTTSTDKPENGIVQTIDDRPLNLLREAAAG